MPYLNQNNMIFVMGKFRKIFSLVICFFLTLLCFFSCAENTYADIKVNGVDEKAELKRSLESLQDFDYKTWQLIVYPSSIVSNKIILRIVGYPGSLRIDHPTSLMVDSGRKTWDLKDITKNSKINVEALNDSAAEFDLSTLIAELDKNRPLRLSLPGMINDLAIPPYLVSEWRSLAEKND